MAKKKHRKKQNFKYSQSPSKSAASATTKVTSKLTQATPAKSAPTTPESSEDFAYVARDLRQVAILAASFVVLELALSYLFSHTGLGSAAYHLIKL